MLCSEPGAAGPDSVSPIISLHYPVSGEPAVLPELSADERKANLLSARERDHAISEALNRAEVGMEMFAISYREPGIMKDQGFLTGVYGIYTHRTTDNQHIATMKDAWRDKFKVNRFSVEGRFAGGAVDYESDETGTRDGLNFYVFELRGLLAYEMPVIPSGVITPFFGMGFRYLKDDSGGEDQLDEQLVL